MFYEVHGDRVPWLGWDRQLFEFSIRLVAQCLGTCTVHTGGDIRFHHSSQAGPVEIPLDKVNGFHLPKVACCRVIVMIADNLEVEVLVVGDVETLFVIESVGLPVPANWWCHAIEFLDDFLCKGVVHCGGGNGIKDSSEVEDIGSEDMSEFVWAAISDVASWSVKKTGFVLVIELSVLPFPW